MALALPHLVPDSRVQGNFDELARMLSDVGSDVLNAADFGADPSGTQDSAGAFEAVMARANPTGSASLPGFPVFIPAGTYLVSRPIPVPPNTLVFGQGTSTWIRVTADATFAFTGAGPTPWYHTHVRDLAIDATVQQTSGGGFDATDNRGQQRLTNIQFGDNLHTFYDGRKPTRGTSEYHFQNLRALSMVSGFVKGVTYGFRLGATNAGAGQTNQIYCNNWSFMAAEGAATCNMGGAFTLPQSTITVTGMPSGLPSSGRIWISDQLVTYGGISGNTFTGCSGGTATLPANAPVRYAGPTWLELQYCDTLYMQSCLFQYGSIGLQVIANADGSYTTDANFSKVAWDSPAFRCVDLAYARDTTFDDCHLTSTCGASRYAAMIIRDHTIGTLWDGVVQRTSGSGIYVEGPARTTIISESSRFMDCGISGIQSTLSAGITGVQTTIPLNDGSAFPPEGGVITINGELIRYTGRSGNTLTGCARGTCVPQGYAAAGAIGGGATVYYISYGVMHAANARRYRVGGVYGNGAKGYNLTGNMGFGVVISGGADEGRFENCDFSGCMQAVQFAYDNGADTATRISGNHMVNP